MTSEREREGRGCQRKIERRMREVPWLEGGEKVTYIPLSVVVR